MKALRKLSQVLGAIGKGYCVDTKVGSFPVTQTITNIAASASTAVMGANQLEATASGVTDRLTLTDPDVYRCLTVVGNKASVYGNVIIKGLDRGGSAVTETILASGTTVGHSNQAFASVSEVIQPAKVDSGETISVGVSDRFGLYRPISSSDDVLEVSKRADAGTSYVVEEAFGAVDTVNGTITLSSGMAIVTDDSLKIEYLTNYF